MDLLSFLYSSFSLNLIIVLGYLTIVLLVCLVPKLIHSGYGRLQSLRLIAKLLFIDPNRLPRLSRKLAVLVLFLNWFFFFNSNFLSSNIKTESVLVKTDEIIVSSLQLLNSKKNFATIFQDSHILRTMPANSLLKKVSDRKHFVIDMGSDSGAIAQIAAQGIGSLFFLARNIALLRLLLMFVPNASSANMVEFLTPNKYHEWLTVFYIRPSLDEQRKRFICRRFVNLATGH